MSEALQIEVTDAQRDSYRRDGVICIRGAFDDHWIRHLREAWESIRHLPPEQTYQLPEAFLKDNPPLAEEVAAIRSELSANRKLYTEQAEGFVRCKYMHCWAPAFREFVETSAAAELVGRVIAAREVRFFIDAIFMKEPNCETSTYWHADQPAWPLSGEHIPTMWMPLYPVSASLSSLEYIAGSHRQPDHSWPNTFNAKRIKRPSQRGDFTDFEARRDDPEVRFLAFDMEPGDVVILHPAMYHGGGANRHPSQPRVALSTRWFGDDVRWDPRPECVNVPGMPASAMRPGEPVREDEIFPILWTQTEEDVQRAHH